MAGGALTPIAPAAAQLYILRAAAPDASAAPFIFTAATEGTGNSRFALGILEFSVILGLDPRISVLGNSKFIYNEIPRSSRGMTQGLGILGILD